MITSRKVVLMFVLQLVFFASSAMLSLIESMSNLLLILLVACVIFNIKVLIWCKAWIHKAWISSELAVNNKPDLKKNTLGKLQDLEHNLLRLQRPKKKINIQGSLPVPESAKLRDKEAKLLVLRKEELPSRIVL